MNKKFFSSWKFLLVPACLISFTGRARVDTVAIPTDVPEIDFKDNLVLFARNTEFYNRIRIGKVNIKGGVAELLAMETMSAMPIEDKVAMSMVMVPREGIAAIQVSEHIIPVNGKI